MDASLAHASYAPRNRVPAKTTIRAGGGGTRTSGKAITRLYLLPSFAGLRIWRSRQRRSGTPDSAETRRGRQESLRLSFLLRLDLHWARREEAGVRVAGAILSEARPRLGHS